MSQMGQFLPRHLTERAAALPYKAAAPTVLHGGSYGPQATKVRRSKVRYSITSSASARTLSGMVRPSALAVFRLMINSKCVGF